LIFLQYICLCRFPSLPHIYANLAIVRKQRQFNSLPSLLRLEALAHALGVPLTELLSESTNLCTDQSLLIQGWIAGLSEADRKFMLDMVQAWSLRLKS
jgi:hypothetical protein